MPPRPAPLYACSGKTALVAKLCRELRGTLQLAVVTNDIYTTEDADFLRDAGVLDVERIVAVETGCCPHTAIRDDIAANLDAVEELERQFAPLDLVLVESGGDNLTATFSQGLVDRQVFVIDVAGGDKVPRKGGPGITRADLLIVNKIDLAPLVGADLEVMARDAAAKRGDRPTGASVARRGHEGATSLSTTSARVGDGATLCWLVEPGIATGGSRHVARLGFEVSPTARLCWREEVVLGRVGDDKPGSWSSRMRVVVGGRSLLVNRLDLGHEAHTWRSPTVVAGARAFVGITIIDPTLGEDPSGLGDQASVAAAQGVVCALPGPGLELMAWGRELDAARMVAGLLLSRLEMPWLPRELLPG